MVIVEKCKEEMIRQGISRQKLAGITGIPLPTIHSIFNGRSQSPSWMTMIQICQALGVSVDGTYGIKNQDMGKEERARIDAEYNETKEELQRSIENHNNYMAHQVELAELKDKQIDGLEKRNAELNDRINSQVVVINIFRVWILALHIYGLLMDSLDTTTGLIRFPLLDVLKSNGLSVTAVIAIAVSVYLIIFWITKRKSK